MEAGTVEVEGQRRMALDCILEVEQVEGAAAD